jgi:hypothetical protein
LIHTSITFLASLRTHEVDRLKLAPEQGRPHLSSPNPTVSSQDTVIIPKLFQEFSALPLLSDRRCTRVGSIRGHWFGIRKEDSLGALTDLLSKMHNLQYTKFRMRFKCDCRKRFTSIEAMFANPYENWVPSPERSSIGKTWLTPYLAHVSRWVTTSSSMRKSILSREQTQHSGSSELCPFQ